MDNTYERDVTWMRLALEEAEAAAQNGELPIAAILVGGDKEITRAQTQTGRRQSMTGHAELWALIAAQRQVYSAPKPLTIYTTLEPCLMCLGAAIQCGVGEVVFAMDAPPDGGTRLVDEILRSGQTAPSIRRGVLKEEAVSQMQRFVEQNGSHPGIRYARLLLQR
jgi:tRNA(adenine34) deaminase